MKRITKEDVIAALIIIFVLTLGVLGMTIRADQLNDSEQYNKQSSYYNNEM